MTIVLSTNLVSTSANAISVQNWVRQSAPGVDTTYWAAIASSDDGTKLVAAESNSSYGGGAIHTSTDSGLNWTRRTSAGLHGWVDLTSSSDGSKLAGVTSNGYVHTSDDFGVTWVVQTGSGSRSWTSITSSDTGIRLAATSANTIFISNDYGATWSQGNATIHGMNTWGPISITGDGSKLVVIGTYGGSGNGSRIFYSLDFGFTWNPAWGTDESNFSSGWSDVASNSDGTKLVAAMWNGKIHTSVDSGATWSPKGSSTNFWSQISLSNDGAKLIALASYGGQQSYVYVSEDDGVNMTSRTSSGNRYWNSLAASSDGNKVFITESYGSVFLSSNFGSTWERTTVSNDRSWQSVTSSSNGNNLAAVVSGGSLYTSTDSGQNWTPRTTAGSRYWTAVASNHEGTKIAAVVGGGFIYTSSDSGASWTERTSPGDRYWTSIASSSDGTKLFATATLGASSSGGLFTSSDSGVTWTEQAGAGNLNWSAIACSDDATKVFATEAGGDVYKSIDSGVTWAPTSAASYITVGGPLAGSNNWSGISSSSNGSILAVVVGGGGGSPGYVYTSTDSGVTWDEIQELDKTNWGSVTVSDDGQTLVVAELGGYIHISKDAGTTWTAQTSAGEGNWSSLVANFDGTKLVATVNGGGLFTLIPIPAFTLSQASETATAGAPISGYSILSTGGNIASYSISPAIENGLLFSTSTGQITGTPTNTAPAKTYTITATNVSGSTSRTFTVTVTPALQLPAFTFSRTTESATVGTAISGYTVSSTGGTVASYAINPSIGSSPGLTFSTSTGRITGTPSATSASIVYTVTGTNATGSYSQTFTISIIAAIINSTPPTTIVPPTPAPFLIALTTPKLSIKGNELICSPGTFQSGFTLGGNVLGNSSINFTPPVYVYNILVNGVTHPAQSLNTSASFATWTLLQLPKKSLITCAVTVSENGLTLTSKSSDAIAAVAAALTQDKAISEAHAEYSLALNKISKAHEKILVDNRKKWRIEVETIRSSYLSEKARIQALPSTKSTRAQTSLALMQMTSATKKSTTDYAASKLAAAAAKDASTKAALDAKNVAVAKANATYGTFIESIGYGVLIP